MGIVLTHNAKYKPMSFEDMIKPYVMATEEYRLLEKGIADLDTEAENLRSIAEKDIVRKDDGSIDKEKSKGYAIKYMDYANSLDKQAEQLASRGLKGVNRKSLYDLQAQYKTNVKPIEEADKYIKEIAKEQRLANKEGNLVFDRDFSNGVSIQDVIDNPSLGYNAYNLDDYGKQAVLEGTAIKSGMTPTYLGKDPTNQNIFYSQGMSDEDLNNWLAGTSNEELDATVNRIAGNAPQAVKDRVKSDLAKSLRATVSKEANRGYETPAQINSRIKSDASLTAQMARNNYEWDTKTNTWKLNPLGVQEWGIEQDAILAKQYKKLERNANGNYDMNNPKIIDMTKEEIEKYEAAKKEAKNKKTSKPLKTTYNSLGSKIVSFNIDGTSSVQNLSTDGVSGVDISLEDINYPVDNSTSNTVKDILQSGKFDDLIGFTKEDRKKAKENKQGEEATKAVMEARRLKLKDFLIKKSEGYNPMTLKFKYDKDNKQIHLYEEGLKEVAEENLIDVTNVVPN